MVLSERSSEPPQNLNLNLPDMIQSDDEESENDLLIDLEKQDKKLRKSGSDSSSSDCVGLPGDSGGSFM